MKRLLPLSLLWVLASCGSGGKDSADPEGDVDGDGVVSADDCDDHDATSYPGAEEVCDGADNDCDGDIDEGLASTWYADADADGFGDGAVSIEACAVPSGYVADSSDCDDDDSTSHPGAAEVCDGADNDCNGVVDDGVTSTWYPDADGDGYGDASQPLEACSGGSGLVANGDDCDDNSPAIHPAGIEVCDGVDNDCDGSSDEPDAVDAIHYYNDADGDGFGDEATGGVSCRQPPGTITVGGDCDDGSANVNPDAPETCDGADNDCDGITDEADAVDVSIWYQDADGDGWGDESTSQVSCDAATGYVAESGDCDDSAVDIHPGATEICDELDNDCNGAVDDDPIDGAIYYLDADSDGFGDPETGQFACSQLSGFVLDASDCDDSNPSEPVIVDFSTGSPSGSGSLDDPLDTIQAGIDLASACVRVNAGIYAESIDFRGKNLQVLGVEGSAATTIDASGMGGPAVAIMSGESGAVLSGFTLTGGTGYLDSSSVSTACTSITTCVEYFEVYCGGGLYMSGASATLSDLVVSDHTLPDTSTVTSGDDTWYTWSYGGGLCFIGASVTLDDVAVTGNHADQGGGIYASEGAALVATHLRVSDNTATDGAGLLLEAATLDATNTIWACNTAVAYGGGLLLEDSGASATFENAVFYQDVAAEGAGYGAASQGDATSHLTLTNTIVYTAIGAWALYGEGSGSFNYNDVYNAYSSGYTYGGSYSAGSGSISADPLFLGATCDGDPSNDDFHLNPASPCVDAGKPYSSYYDTDGSLNDMGAYGGQGGEWP